MMPSKEDLIRIAKNAAALHDIDPSLVCAVCEHESEDWNPWAMRFEPAFDKKYEQPMHKLPTEEIACSTSWGLMQIMGQTARELGFTHGFLTQLLDPAIGIEFGCRKLRHCLDRNSGDVHKALLMYNGGSNLSYPDLVMPRMAKYQPPPAPEAPAEVASVEAPPEKGNATTA